MTDNLKQLPAPRRVNQEPPEAYHFVYLQKFENAIADGEDVVGSLGVYNHLCHLARAMKRKIEAGKGKLPREGFMKRPDLASSSHYVGDLNIAGIREYEN